MRTHKSVYEKPSPSKDGGLIYLFCEGEDTEPNYFKYFKKQSSNLNLYIVPFPTDGNNSHIGLFDYCMKVVSNTENDFAPTTDSIWLCVDTDDQGDNIEILKENIAESPYEINIAQSNRSFEVWLYYHFHSNPPEDIVTNWKTHLNDCIPGGFDLRSNPSHATTAVKNAKKHYNTCERNQPLPNHTNVFELVEVILDIIKD